MSTMHKSLGSAMLAACLAAMSACSGSGSSDAPPLAAVPGDSTPPEKNWIESTGDAAWNAVASPINGLVPKPRPKPEPVELVPIQPPEMVIITRGERGTVTVEPEAPATRP